MTFKDGDFVKIEYSIWRGSDNKLVITTDKNIAEKNNAYDENFKYKPHLVVVGKDNMIKGVVDAIKEMDEGNTKKLEIQPENAFGDRIQELVKVLPVSEFRKRDMDPSPGMQVEIDGGVATIMSVNSGRVMIDSNHPLAGERISCEIKIIKKINTDEEKAKAILEEYNLSYDNVKLNNNIITLSFGDSVKKDGRYFIDKSSAVDMIIKDLEKVDKVVVEEIYLKTNTNTEEKK